MAVLKRSIPTAVAIAIGLIVLAAILVPIPAAAALGTRLIEIAVVLAAFALFLGLFNVIHVHAQKIVDRQTGWLYSLILIASMLVVLALGLPSYNGQPSGPSQPGVQWMFHNILAPIQASLSALLVFFLVTAAFRLLRIRNLESAVMLVVVLLVLIGQVTVGLLPILPEVKEWILDVPTLAGVRGILLGVAIGAVLTGLRLLLGVERPYSD
jgi:hypothetical protein